MAVQDRGSEAPRRLAHGLKVHHLDVGKPIRALSSVLDNAALDGTAEREAARPRRVRLRPRTNRYVAIALDVFTLRDARIAAVTAFRSPELFGLFGLPDELPA